MAGCRYVRFCIRSVGVSVVGKTGAVKHEHTAKVSFQGDIPINTSMASFQGERTFMIC
jgi:hypothetical protein